MGVDLEDQLKRICVIASLTALTGKSAIELIGEICLSAGVGAKINIQDGCIDRPTYVNYLRGLGWRDYWRFNGTLPKSIPMTCMCVLGPAEEGHAFAIVDGKLYDNGTNSRWGREIIAIVEPQQGGAR